LKQILSSEEFKIENKEMNDIFKQALNMFVFYHFINILNNYLFKLKKKRMIRKNPVNRATSKDLIKLFELKD
jgi:hypothetical protein